MSQSSASAFPNIVTTEADANILATSSKRDLDSVKDAGRVHVGGLAMRFDSIKDAGRVHVGGLAIKF